MPRICVLDVVIYGPSARKIDITGATDRDGPLADATWAKQRLRPGHQALPNGFCGLPVQKNCPHANA